MDFPRLNDAEEIALDTETRDPGLLINGPGAFRGNGQIIGFSLATKDYSEYFPLFHEGGGNVENPENCINWLRDLMAQPMPKIGANILYDLEWLYTIAIEPKGLKYDIQTAEALLDENMITYSLDACSIKRLGYGKDETALKIRGADYLNINASEPHFEKKIKGLMWKLPADYVAEYARIDAENTYKIFQVQKPLLKEENLWDPLFQTEAKIVDVVYSMRKKGVRVDLDRAKMLSEKIENEYRDLNAHIAQTVGFSINVWANQDVERACKVLNVEPPKTEKGNVSFDSNFLESRPEKFFKLLLRARRFQRAGKVYIEDKIIKLAHNGIVRPQFWAVKTDAHGYAHGTGSGRFASSNPNIQQVPSRDKELAPLVRSIFVPEKGARWLVSDWSQQEPRLTIHFGCKVGNKSAMIAANKYKENPKTDFHQFVADIAGIERKQAKTIFLGLTYGMGKKKLAAQLGLNYNEADQLHAKIHAAFPFIKELVDRSQAVANRRGFIKTLLGRKMRFDLYGPNKWEVGIRPRVYEEALKKYGHGIKRYFVYKALNRLIQGSAADMMKMAMVRVFEAGYTPNITLHDEMDFSVYSDKQIKEIQNLMCEGYGLECPLAVDLEVGPSWGEVKEYAIS